MLDVRRLLVLRAVAQHGSLAAAARALGYTQPAVSHHVRRLEQEAGVRLVTRDGRGVQLTAAGRALVARAEAIAVELTAAEAELAAAVRNMAAHVRMAALPSANTSLVPRALAELRIRHLEITVVLVEAGPQESWSLLDRAECDLAVSSDHPDLPPWPPTRVTTVPLLDDPVLVMLPAAHPLASASEVPLDRLSEASWILSNRCQREMLHACGRAGFTPNVALVTDDYNLAVRPAPAPTPRAGRRRRPRGAPDSRVVPTCAACDCCQWVTSTGAVTRLSTSRRRVASIAA